MDYTQRAAGAARALAEMRKVQEARALEYRLRALEQQILYAIGLERKEFTELATHISRRKPGNARVLCTKGRSVAAYNRARQIFRRS